MKKKHKITPNTSSHHPMKYLWHFENCINSYIFFP